MGYVWGVPGTEKNVENKQKAWKTLEKNFITTVVLV